jgi:hypothetical protein
MTISIPSSPRARGSPVVTVPGVVWVAAIDLTKTQHSFSQSNFGHGTGSAGRRRDVYRADQQSEEVAPPPDPLTLPKCLVRQVYIPEPFATFIFPRAAFNPAVSLPSSSFAQKCMKNKRG